MEPVDNESDVQRETGAQSLSPGETPSAEASERSTPNSQIEGSQSQAESKLCQSQAESKLCQSQADSKLWFREPHMHSGLFQTKESLIPARGLC